MDTVPPSPPVPEVPDDENPVRTVWALAWPAVALNSLQVINSLLDSGFIGHLPSSALKAYGGLTNVAFLLFSLAMAISTAATALVSRSYGAGEVAEFRKACRQSISISLASGIVLALFGAIGAPAAADLFLPNSELEAKREMVSYLGIYAAGLPAIYLIQSLAGALRGVGDTKSPMVISGIQILLHILLNFVLIFPPREIGGIVIPGMNMGLDGAAAALSISAWMSAILYLAYTPRTKLGNCMALQLPQMDWVRRILRIAIPAGTMAVLRVASLAIFTIVLKLSAQGAVAVAAMRPGFAIESIMFMPSFGLSMAAAALVGQSLGMGKPDRAERLTWTAAHHAALVTATLCLPIFIFAQPIADALIANKPDISHEAAMLLRYLCVTEIGFAYAMVMIGAMQGAGDTKRPLWITIVALWGLRVPLAFLFALGTGAVIWQFSTTAITMPFGMGMGSSGAWLSMSITQAVQGILAVIAFKQGAWKLQKV
jgi:putative MATE family efflux protein